MVLVQKWPIFPLFFLGNIGQENVFYHIIQQKTTFQAIKTVSEKIRNIDDFSRGQPMVLVQKWPFFQICFQAIQARKMSVRIFQSEKTPPQSIKTRSSKSRKIDIFSKGLTHRFGPKMTIFPTFFFFGNIARKNGFYDILERKNAFLGYKNKKIIKSKN